MLDRDPRYNGIFFYAVRTTGIYCLPTCSAVRPDRRNVRFFSSSKQAEAAGYRPCKRCRPDQAWHTERLCSEDAVQKNAAVMFVDMRGSSAHMAHMSTLGAFQEIRTYYDAVCRIVDAHGGVVQKYLGDGVLILFEQSPFGRNEAANALACAREMISSFDHLSIGMHYGPVGSGVIASPDGPHEEVIGTTVNMAKRLEQLTRRRHVRLLVSDDCVRAAGRPSLGCNFIVIGRVRLRGCGTTDVLGMRWLGNYSREFGDGRSSCLIWRDPALIGHQS